MLNTFVVLGATGDLAGRLLLPAVAGLQASGALGPDFRLVGAGYEAWTDDEFAAHVRRRLAAHAPQAEADAVVATLRYCRADVTDAADVAAVLDLAGASEPLAVYLALPTQLLLDAVRALRAAGLPAGSRIAVEKPFGHDAASARELNAALAGADGYRVDHALAMPAVPALRHAPDVEWSARHIEQVDLLWEETLALEGRASFYDRAGALRDVVQNHLVQLLCTVAAPTGGTDGRAAVLRAVQPLDVRTSTRRARYTAGRLARGDGADGRAVPDYTAEDGVDPARDTETFAEATLLLDLPHWAGTRFALRAGKALSTRRRGVLVHFRPALHRPPLWLDVDAGSAVPAEPAAYEGVVTDLLGGGSTFAVGAEEIELAWALFTPVLRAWAANEVPLASYPAGSAGPG